MKTICFILALTIAVHAVPKFQEINGIVCAETENAAKVTSWSEHSDGAASGGKYMKATKGKCSSCTMDFPAHFTQTGWYRIFIRCRSTTHSDNDAYMTLDGKGGFVQDGGNWRGPVEGIKTNHRNWGWESQAKHGGDTPSWASKKPVYVEVKGPGEHTFKIGARSKDFKIDKLVLVKQGNSFKPADKGPAETLYGDKVSIAKKSISNSMPDEISISTSRSQVTVSAMARDNYTVSLFNALGNRIATCKLNGGTKCSMPVASGAGVYFAKIQSQQKQFVSKITLR